MKERGLELSPEKTKISHLSEGFNFLGFNIRHYKAAQTSRSGWKLLIKPSKKSVQQIRDKLRDKWLLLKGQNVEAVLSHLNPVIRGWANYFRIGVAGEIFHALDHWMNPREIRYVKHTHPNKPRYWTQEKYFGRLNLERQDNWVFGDKRTGSYLLKFSWFPVERHALIQGDASPDDPGLKGYWEWRNMAKAKTLILSKQKLAKRQRGICLHCGESLFNGEEVHTHRNIPGKRGGEYTYGNIELVHLFCHQQKHANESSPIKEQEEKA